MREFVSGRCLTAQVSGGSYGFSPSVPHLQFRPDRRTFVNAIGAVAQLGERYIRIVEVEGSTPFCSTTFEDLPVEYMLQLFTILRLPHHILDIQHKHACTP